MTRHTTIIAGRGARKHAVRVERRRKRKFVAGWTRLQVHRRGLAAVADEFGLAGMLDLGGIMTGDRMREVLGRKGVRSGTEGNRASAAENARPINVAPGDLRVGKPDRDSGRKASSGVEKWDTAPGLLAADISRNIFPDRQRQFGADLIGGVL